MRPGWLLFTIGLVLLACWTSPAEASSNLTQRELKALRAALKKQHRAKEQRASSNKVKAQQSAGGEYVPEAGPWSSTSATEPTCEQLREMWRQSKRHSRAAEATNEIPQYNDPFARSVYARQTAAAAAGQAEPTLRPRPERRPVVYGRLHSSPSDLEGNSERPLRPFEVLRKLQQKTSSSSSDDNGDSGAVILYGEDDKPPFARAAARGSLQHLREMVREEGAGPVKGSFKHLREIVREEQQQQQQQQGRNRHQARSSSGDWTEADVGRVVTSPSDHSGGKYSLYSTMQGDAPYEDSSSSEVTSSSRIRQHNNNKAASSSSRSGSSKVFHKVDPARPRPGNIHNHRSRASSYHQPGASRDYVYSGSSKSSRTTDCEDAEEDSAGCRNQLRRRCLRGRCIQQISRPKAPSMDESLTEDDVVQDIIDALQEE